MAEIIVNVGTLNSKAAELRSLNSSFKAQVEKLKERENVLNGMWDGEANDAFHAAFYKDAGQMNNFYNEIEKYAQALLEIVKKFERAEATNKTIATNRNY